MSFYLFTLFFYTVVEIEGEDFNQWIDILFVRPPYTFWGKFYVVSVLRTDVRIFLNFSVLESNRRSINELVWCSDKSMVIRMVG